MLWIFLFGIGFTLFFCGMPKYYDDYWYMAHLRPWFDAQGLDTPENGGNIFRYGIPFSLIFDTWAEHFAIDNARLGNLLAPILLLWPKWVGSGLISIIWIWSALLGFKIAGIDWKHSPLVPVGLFLWTFITVWRDHFGSLVFQLNYIPPTWLALLVLWRINRSLSNIDVSDKKVGVDPLLIVLSFLLGIWHEGFGVPIGSGLLCAMLFCPRWRTKNVAFAAASMIFGSALLLLVPGMHQRANDSVIGFNLHLFDHFIYIFKYDLPIFVLNLLLFALTLIVRGTKQNKNLIPLFIITLVSSVALIFTLRAIGTGTRVLFWVEFISAVLIIDMLRVLIPDLAKRYSPLTAIMVTPLLLCVFVHLASVDYFSFKCRRLMVAMIPARLMGKAESHFESEPYFSARIAPLGKMPDANFNFSANAYVGRYCSDLHSTPDKDGFLIAYPLKRATADSGRLLGAEQGIRSLENCLYISSDSLAQIGYNGPDITHYVDLDYGKGFRRVICAIIKFTSPADGKEYGWITIKVPWHLPYIRELKNVRVVPESESKTDRLGPVSYSNSDSD